jgi:hypothetical protein
MTDDIHIGAPDGSIVAFPAGTSDDTIRAAMAKAYPPPAATTSVAPTEPKSTLQTIREAIHAPTRALENGAMLGLGDRARALIDTVVSKPRSLSDLVTGEDNSYAANLAREQGDTEDFQKAHPVAAPVLEAVGGVVAPIAVVGAMAKGATFGTKTLIGAGTGGAIGTVQGALGSKDWTDLRQVANQRRCGRRIWHFDAWCRESHWYRL